ncbi:hypothetical protein H4J58_09410 [Colwellia sp. MB3u-70]|uniref:hypothetical protein n=1 Tax=unclassified Colwellia TaxID=196834 RepID=UPI0015F6BEBF|nr:MULTISPECIES: hypothetical protein [unclassified Colwellia]MBA6291255.1 hypothetical protein [Colwellia sp. MB3u-8]MBA6307329.1 hypothetical protein [Colwellia sp. MB3u-70]
MKGQILHISESTLIIRAENDQKLEVSISEIKSEITPHVGDTVDFDIIEEKAVNIFILRQTASLDEHLNSAKEMAGNLFSKAKGQLNEENAQKAKNLASQATNKAKESLKNIDYSKATNAIKNIKLPTNTGTAKLHNKFAFLIVVLIFISMVLPLVDIGFGSSQSYFQLVESNSLMVIFLLLSAVSLVLGLPRLITRSVSIIFLIIASMPVYDGINALNDMGMFSSRRRSNLDGLDPFFDIIQIGMPLLVISIVIFTILQMLPFYQVSNKFKPQAEVPLDKSSEQAITE